MQVRHRLARMRAMVHNQAEALGKLEFLGDQTGDEQEMSQQRLIRSGRLAEARNYLLRYDEKMNRRLRLHVVQNDAVFVLMLNPSGNLAIDDLLKDGFHAVVRSE